MMVMLVRVMLIIMLNSAAEDDDANVRAIDADVD